MNGLHEPPDDLITGLLRQSYAGVVRQRLLAIERAVQSGQRHEHIARELERVGACASVATFRKSLSRARIWWRRQIAVQMERRALMAADMAGGKAQGMAGDELRNQAEVVPSTEPTAQFIKQESSSQGAHTRKPAGSGRVDLDQFFKSKSVFTKT